MSDRFGSTAELSSNLVHTDLCNVTNDSLTLEQGDGGNTVPHYVGPMNNECTYCYALYFNSERTGHQKIFTKCCMGGKYVFDFNFNVPKLIKELLCNDHRCSNNFVENIRQYNSSLAFASFGASVAAGNVPGGAYCFKVQGVIHHLSSNLREEEHTRRKYSQLYFIDSELANECRKTRYSRCLPELFTELDTLLREENIYATTLLNLREVEEREMRQCYYNNAAISIDYSVWLLKKPAGNSIDRKRYSLPTCNEIAAVFSSSDGRPPHLRDIEIHSKSGKLIQLSACSQHTNPMVYPILYPYGGGGWHPGFKARSGETVSLSHYIMLFC